jgi:hemoglobin
MLRGMAEFKVGMPGSNREDSLYLQLGGMEFFEELVRRFYTHVAEDPTLLALYPDPEDLAPARERLHLFLAQYFGGPSTYSERRGHPRLRMRHMEFRVDPEGVQRWLAAMQKALDELGVSGSHRTALWDYFSMAAEAMRNAD